MQKGFKKLRGLTTGFKQISTSDEAIPQIDSNPSRALRDQDIIEEPLLKVMGNEDDEEAHTGAKMSKRSRE